MLWQRQRALSASAAVSLFRQPLPAARLQHSRRWLSLLSSSSSSPLRSSVLPAAAPRFASAQSRVPFPSRPSPHGSTAPLPAARGFVTQTAVVAGVLLVGVLLRAKWREIRAMRPDLQSVPLDPDSASSAAARFHEGGFLDKMDRREAALILGVREGASRERVMLRYRMLMKVNHPDLGGSPYVSTKINEAKELLSKTARSEHEGAADRDRERDRDRDRSRDRAAER